MAKISLTLLSIALLFLSSTFSAMASEGARYDIKENTLTIPAVNIGDQSFYYLQLSLSSSEPDIIFDVKEVREIERPSSSEAYYSTGTSRLSVPSVDVGGAQWIVNLDLLQDSNQFRADSMLLPFFDVAGGLTDVEYIDSSMNKFTFHFNEVGNIESVESIWLLLSYVNNDRIVLHTLNSHTHIGELDAADLESISALSKFFDTWWHAYSAEETSGTTDTSSTPYGFYADTGGLDLKLPALANAISNSSWIVACAYATVSSNSRESIVEACESSSNL